MRKGTVKKIVIRTFIGIFMVIFFLGLGLFSYVYANYGKEVKQILDITSDIRNERIEVVKPLNILILGLDVGDINNSNDNTIKRTDTIMLMHYDPEKAKADIVSIPRDTMFYYKGKKNKINAAYPIGGDALIKSTVEIMLDTHIDNIVKIDYRAFREIVDAIGGVKMYIERDMNYDDPSQNLSIHFKKGDTVLLDGKGAEEFFRWRKNNDGTGFIDGDMGRIENQHKLMKKIFQKCISPAIITKIDDILDVVKRNVETDMSFERMVSYGTTLIRLNNDSIIMHTLKGEPKYVDRLWFFIYEKEKNVDIINTLNDKALITDIK